MSFSTVYVYLCAISSLQHQFLCICITRAMYACVTRVHHPKFQGVLRTASQALEEASLAFLQAQKRLRDHLEETERMANTELSELAVCFAVVVGVVTRFWARKPTYPLCRESWQSHANPYKVSLLWPCVRVSTHIDPYHPPAGNMPRKYRFPG